MAHPTVEELKDRSPSLDGAIEAIPAWYQEVTLRLITDMEQLRAFLAEAAEASIVACDLETTSLNSDTGTIVGVSLAYNRQEAVYIPVAHKRDKHLNLDPKVVWPALQELFNKTVMLFFNGKFDVSWLEDNGLKVPKWEDTSISCFLLNSNRKTTGLKHMAKVVLGRVMLELQEVTGKGNFDFSLVSPLEAAKYAAGDSLNTLELHVVLEPVRKEQAYIYKVETAAAEACRVMERNRVKIDLDYCREMWKYLSIEVSQVKADIFALAKRSFDIESPKQCGVVLFDELKIPNLEPKTKSGQYDTSAEHLQKLEAHPICKLILLVRSLEKAQATYVERLIEAGESDSRGAKFCFFNCRVPTGRLASGSGGDGSGYANVNVQSIPANYGEVVIQAFKVLDRPGQRKPEQKAIPVGRQFLWEEIGIESLIGLAADQLEKQDCGQFALSTSTSQQQLVAQIQTSMTVTSDQSFLWEESVEMPTEAEAEAFLASLDPTAGKPAGVKSETAGASSLLAELVPAPATPAPSVVSALIADEVTKVPTPQGSGLALEDVVKQPPVGTEVSIDDLLPPDQIQVPPAKKQSPPLHVEGVKFDSAALSKAASSQPAKVVLVEKKASPPPELDAAILRELEQQAKPSLRVLSAPKPVISVVKDSAQELLDSL